MNCNIIMIALFITGSLGAMDRIEVIKSYMSPNAEPIKNNLHKPTFIGNYEPKEPKYCGICFKEKPGEEFKFWPCYDTKWAHNICYTIMSAIEKKHIPMVGKAVEDWLSNNGMLIKEKRVLLINSILKDARERLAVNLLTKKEQFMDYIDNPDGGIVKLSKCYDNNIKNWVSLYLEITATLVEIRKYPSGQYSKVEK